MGKKIEKIQDGIARASTVLDRLATAKANPEVVQAAVDELRAELDALTAAAEAEDDDDDA
jgi:hypothetical protein